MRTTIDLPDDVFRRAKSEAALRGMKFKDYAAALFKQGLPESQDRKIELGRNRPIPVVFPAGTMSIPEGVTNADLFEAIHQEDDAKIFKDLRSPH